MRRRPFALLALALLLSNSVRISKAEETKEKEPEHEVHVVCIYEGYVKTGKTIHGPRANIHVNRPGKKVTLVLTSALATWYVTASEETKIHRVILGGRGQQAVEGVPATAEIIKAWAGVSNTPIGGTNRPVGPAFRGFVKRVYDLTGLELSSFNYSYRPSPEKPLTIDSVNVIPQFSIDYPQPTPIEALPIEARDITFPAHHYHDGFSNPSYGEYTLAGPKADSLKTVPRGVGRLTYDSDQDAYYAIAAGHNVARVNWDNNTIQEMDLGLDVPPLSWPCDITYDTKRKRIILGSLAGGGYFYAYSPENNKWSVIAERPAAVDNFAYSPADDCIYGLLVAHRDGKRLLILKINLEGAIVDQFELIAEANELIFPFGACAAQVVAAGKYVVLLAAPDGHGDGGLKFESIFLVDPATKKSWLTYKEPTRRSSGGIFGKE